MQTNHYFPCFLDISKLKILIIGAGKVGKRKVTSLFKAEPKQIMWVDKSISDADIEKFFEQLIELTNNEASSIITYRQVGYDISFLEGMNLVFACTENEEINSRIVSDCAIKNIICNCVTNPKESSFIVPATANFDGIQLAVGTSGNSPAFSVKIRDDIVAEFLPRYSGVAQILGQFRPLILSLQLEQEENAKIFRGLAGSLLPQLITLRKRDQAQKELESILPSSLHESIAEILDNFF